MAAARRFADVTVVVPAFRAAETIDRALASIAAQTLLPQAIVVVDDGSPDDTFARASAWRGRLNEASLTVLQQPNGGPGAARNRAISKVTTTWVAFLDADDEWLPRKIERSMAYAETGDFVLLAHDSVEVEDGRERRLDCSRRFRESNAPFVGLYRRGFIDTATVVARTDAIRTAGGFDESLPNAQDFDLWLAILTDPGARFLIFDETLARYHRMPNSVMSHIDRRRRCCMVIARRHVAALSMHPGSPLMSLWFRTIAVHREAVVAHRTRGDWGGIARTAFALPINLILGGTAYLSGRRLAAQRRSSRLGT